MHMSSRAVRIGIAVLVAVATIGAVYAFRSQENKNTEGRSGEAQSDGQSEEKALAEDQLAGKLMDSDNVELGNYMLVAEDTKVYLNTIRNFQPLVGREVVVTIDGTLDSFRLVDIKEK